MSRAGCCGLLSGGQLVYSKCGRDKGGLFMVIAADAEYVRISDGKTRRVDAPKKKKLKHVQPVNYIDGDAGEALAQGRKLLDADIRRSLSMYKESRNKEVVNFVEK